MKNAYNSSTLHRHRHTGIQTDKQRHRHTVDQKPPREYRPLYEERIQLIHSTQTQTYRHIDRQTKTQTHTVDQKPPREYRPLTADTDTNSYVTVGPGFHAGTFIIPIHASQSEISQNSLSQTGISLLNISAFKYDKLSSPISSALDDICIKVTPITPSISYPEQPCPTFSLHSMTLLKRIGQARQLGVGKGWSYCMI